MAPGPVTDGAGPGPDALRAGRSSHPMIVWAVLRIVGSITALVALYYALPLTHSTTGIAVTILVIGLAVFIGLVAFHARSITRSPFPGLRAVEALAVNAPLFLLLFASTYVVMATMSAGNFGERLTHTDGLYFTVTVLSTVGFGDITPKTQAARLVVTGQMIADLVIFALAVKVIVGAVSRGRQAGHADGTQPAQETPPLAAAWSQALVRRSGIFNLGQCRWCSIFPVRPRTPVKCNPNHRLGKSVALQRG
jgi:voltage-gated potassium channel